MRRTLRPGYFALVLGLMPGLAGCTDAFLGKGEVMLVITTDYQPGADIDEIGIGVNNPGANTETIVLKPTAGGELPALYGIVSGDEGDPITVDVVARWRGQEKNRKTVKPIVPQSGVVTEQPVHLNFLCEGGEKLCESAGSFTCSDDGKCIPKLPPEELPPLEELPEVGPLADAMCLDTIKCFEGATFAPTVLAPPKPPDPLPQCKLKVNTDGVNVALLTTLQDTGGKGPGFCKGSLCYIVLNDTAIQGGKLPETVCPQILSGKLLGVVTAPVTEQCSKKKFDTIPNGWWFKQCAGGTKDDFDSPWQGTGDIKARSLHAAALLSDDRVIVHGGVRAEQGETLPVKATHTAQIFFTSSPAISVSAELALGLPRAAHTMIDLRLADDTEVLLIAGGTPSFAPKLQDSPSGFPVPLASFELYNINENANDPPTLLEEGSMAYPRYFQTATHVPMCMDEERCVLIVGGAGAGGEAVASAERFSTMTFTFQEIAMLEARVGHTATLLNDGDVLIVGGGASFDKDHQIAGAPLVTLMERYRSGSGLFEGVEVPLTQPRAFHTATLLGLSGAVLFAGGHDEKGDVLKSVEIFHPGSGQVECTPPMNVERYLHTATLLDSGDVLVVGGFTSQRNPAPAEVFDHQTRKWKIVGVPGDLLREGHTATELEDGSVWIAGGARVTSVSPLALTEQAGTWRYTSKAPSLPPKAPESASCGADPTGGGAGHSPEPPPEIEVKGSGCSATPGVRPGDCSVPSTSAPSSIAPWALALLALAARRRRPD